MEAQVSEVMQFKIELQALSPSIWRQIIIPADYTFWDLHVAIQDAFGWKDYHLHEFKIRDLRTNLLVNLGIPDQEMREDPHFLASWQIGLADYYSKNNPHATYIYDFGDWWEHSAVLEDVYTAEHGVKYPLCNDGARSCPPEDCGGPPGYERLIRILSDPFHEEHELMQEWIGEKFDPEFFDPAKVEFDDPKIRWDRSFGET
jgi:hypothetical protein